MTSGRVANKIQGKVVREEKGNERGCEGMEGKQSGGDGWMNGRKGGKGGAVRRLTHYSSFS